MSETSTNNPILAQASMKKTPYQVAQALEVIAAKLYALETEDDLWVGLSIQPAPSTSDEQKVACIDEIGKAVLGHPGELREMSEGVYHHDASGLVGPVRVGVYSSVKAPEPTDDELATEIDRAEAALEAEQGRAVNDVNTYWRHIFCDNEPEHVQAFRNSVDGSFGPAAGERCEGCGRPTDVEHDWVQIVSFGGAK